jgi:two-component system phosphate regulon sensor histidine kinase PhoR
LPQASEIQAGEEHGQDQARTRATLHHQSAEPPQEDMSSTAPSARVENACEQAAASSEAAPVALPGQRDLSYWEDYFAHSPSMVVAVDEHLRIYDLNPSATARLELSPQAARELPCKEILMCRNMNGTPLCGTSNCPLTRVVQSGEAIPSTELFLGPPPERSEEYGVDIVPAHVNARAGAVFVARSLSNMRVANQVRANFVSMVSHELRTPLNSVHGFIDLLMQGHMGALTDEQHLYLGYTQEGVQQLMTIVEDILFMTRSDSGQFEIRPQKTNSRVLAKQVVTSLKMQARKAAVILDKDIPETAPLLYADPQRMQQVLNNLVANAIKFTPPHGTVTIRVTSHPEQADKVLFAVVDTGDGIPPEDQPHIFERFYQSNHAMQSKMGGYGLGLSIARLIVEQHGGEIWFESAPQQGTTFYFTAPLWTGQDEHTV